MNQRSRVPGGTYCTSHTVSSAGTTTLCDPPVVGEQYCSLKAPAISSRLLHLSAQLTWYVILQHLSLVYRSISFTTALFNAAALFTATAIFGI